MLLTQSFTNSILYAENKFKEILFLTETSLGMLLGILLGKILSEFILNTYYVKVIQLDVVKFFKEVLLQNVFVFLIILTLGFL